MNDFLERCETCGAIVDETEIRINDQTNTTTCTNCEE